MSGYPSHPRLTMLKGLFKIRWYYWLIIILVVTAIVHLLGSCRAPVLTYDDGYTEGYESGYDDGIYSDEAYNYWHDEIYDTAYEQGVIDTEEEAGDAGYTNGHDDGFISGYALGYDDAQNGRDYNERQ